VKPLQILISRSGYMVGRKPVRTVRTLEAELIRRGTKTHALCLSGRCRTEGLRQYSEYCKSAGSVSEWLAMSRAVRRQLVITLRCPTMRGS
jgi:hypothetical protein